MNLQKLLQVILNLLGVYTIFSAIVVSGMSVLAIPFSIFASPDAWSSGGFLFLSVFFQFVIPVVLGMLLIWKSRWLSRKVLWHSGIEPEADSEFLKLQSFPFVAFSLLGVYMLSQTLPSLAAFIATLFREKAAETASITAAQPGFLELYFQEIVYHVVAVGFSLLVFMKGKRFAALALSLRKAG